MTDVRPMIHVDVRQSEYKRMGKKWQNLLRKVLRTQLTNLVAVMYTIADANNADIQKWINLFTDLVADDSQVSHVYHAPSAIRKPSCGSTATTTYPTVRLQVPSQNFWNASEGQS